MIRAKHKKILLASQDLRCVEVILLLLKSWGYEIIQAKDSQEAIESANRAQPDLILVDYSLPGLGGFEVIKELKNDYHNVHIPMLMMIEKRNVRRDILEIEQGLDDYLVKPPDPIDLEVRIEMALRRTEHHFFANSLTKLPGSRMLERAVAQKLQAKEIFSFLYCDINNFKSFNDKYGYKCGDAVIMQTAHILVDIVRRYGQAGDSVFHIGGDDFVILSATKCEAAVARQIIADFDRLTPFHYSAADRSLGFVRMHDRQGKKIDFPLMGISIAIVNNAHRQISSLIEFIEIAFEIKHYLKQHQHSRSLVNRRKIPSLKLTQPKGEVPQTQPKPRRRARFQRYKPLGQVLLEKNLVTLQQLESALFKHWNSTMRLGEVLLDMRLVERPQLDQILQEMKTPSGALSAIT
jgi:DNA-binding response OmpR family regulator